MKKIIAFAAIVSFFIFSVPAAAEQLPLPGAGILPDSSFYFLKEWKEGIQLFFAFGAENKAKQYLHLADVRVAEYLKMQEKGKIEIANRTLEKYELQLGRALELYESAKNKKEVGNLMNEKILNHQIILEGVLAAAPEQAKAGLLRAIEASAKVLEKTGGFQETTGGQTDEKGCLTAAGYSWCEAKQKCLRVWEEKCQDSPENIDFTKNGYFSNHNPDAEPGSAQDNNAWSLAYDEPGSPGLAILLNFDDYSSCLTSEGEKFCSQTDLSALMRVKIEGRKTGKSVTVVRLWQLNEQGIPVYNPPEGAFCGSSTKGRCSKSSDCVKSGCSGQICQSKNEEPAITDCAYKDCFNASAYMLECRCVDNQCQWHN